MIIKILIPNDILNPLWDEDEKEEEEEVGGRVADELQEGFPHHLVQWHNMLCNGTICFAMAQYAMAQYV